MFIGVFVAVERSSPAKNSGALFVLTNRVRCVRRESICRRTGLAHRGEPGVSDANNERNTFGVYDGGGARINVCLTKPV